MVLSRIGYEKIKTNEITDKVKDLEEFIDHSIKSGLDDHVKGVCVVVDTSVNINKYNNCGLLAHEIPADQYEKRVRKLILKDYTKAGWSCNWNGGTFNIFF